jgi:hypothetical protein
MVTQHADRTSGPRSGVREGCPNLSRVDLLLFTVDPSFAAAVTAAGAAGVVVDWERRGKHRRQAGEGTQINGDTPADLVRVRAATPARVVVRVNGAGPWTAREVDTAVALGADEVLLPMVRTPAQVDGALEAAAGRVGVGILVETQAGVAAVRELVARPLARVYLGLNDLRIDRGSDRLFAPLVDGTATRVAAACSSRGLPFGVAGLTLPDRGAPVPSWLLAGELARLGASFTFLRRSFTADVAGRDVAVEVPRLLADCARAAARTPSEVAEDRAALVAAVGPLPVAVPA